MKREEKNEEKRVKKMGEEKKDKNIMLKKMTDYYKN